MKITKKRAALALVFAVMAASSQAKDTRSGPNQAAPADTGMTMNQTAAPMGQPDAQMQAVLDELGAMNGKPIESLSAAEARQQPTPTDAVKALLEKQGKPTTPDPAVTSADRNIQTSGGSLPVRIYTPKDGDGPFPIVVYYHGGGWVIADLDVYDSGPRALSKLANAVVVSVHYRQGPENKFPAAHDDAYAAYEWTLANAASIKGNAKKVALAGESAGGGLAVSTAIMARDKSAQMPLAVVSVYPIAGTDTTTASYVENAKAKPLNAPMMIWFFEKYLNGRQDYSNPRVDLVNADLAGLPPVTIINAQIDPLRSDGEMLASKLKAAGVTTEQKTWPGVTHEFFGMAAVVDKAKQANQMAADALKRAFGT